MKDTNIPNKETLDRLLELGALNTEIRNTAKINNGLTPYAIVPSGCAALDLSEFFPPARIAQCVELLEAGSFIAYVNRYKTPDTLIFADISESEAKFKAVLDYHTAAPALTPHHGWHKAQFTTLKTPEFVAWLAANGKRMSQVDFATWLEENGKLFTEPTGADLMELVETLYGTADVRFDSTQRLQSGGSRFNYSEDVVVSGNSTTRGGVIELPKTVKALVPVFQGSAAYVIEARLKYRVEGRKLTLWLETIDLPRVVRHAIMETVKQVAQPDDAGLKDITATSGTGIMPLLGRINS